MNIKELRQKHNLSQTDIAKITNTSQRTISAYEKGESEPTASTIIALADYFRMTTDALLNHNVPYLVDKSTLTAKQKEIVNIVPQLTDEECTLLLAYLAGIRKGIEERNKRFGIYEN